MAIKCLAKDTWCKGRRRAGPGTHEHLCLLHRPTHGTCWPLGLTGGLADCSDFERLQLPGNNALTISPPTPVYRLHPPSNGRRILVACGPGNNGGDGLVAARHLCHYGYKPLVFYPKRSKNELYQRLAKQLEDLDVPFVEDFSSAMSSTDHIVDAIFGFSFLGEVREPFPAVIEALETTKLPVTSVDAPSSWNIEDGPPQSGLGSSFMPTALVSLTAPKPLVKHFTGRHFIGGRFVSPSIAEKYNIEVPEYEGIDQVVEVGKAGEKL
ncbi:Fc.00g059710.m01.CDS01 [Cosmosporella sp. VM-42]